jgi:hypothetical protein
MAWLILTHRWAGIVLCLMMTVWCLSGGVLMYFGLPHLNAGERLSRLPSLDASSIRVAPADAAAKAGGNAFRIRLSMLDDRPVYRVNTGNVFGRWTLVYADNGDVFPGSSPDKAVRWLEGYVPEARGRMELEATLHGPDLYTHNPGLYTPRQLEAGARSVQGQGPRLPLTDISAAQVREAAAAAIAAFPVKELELISVNGEPWWLTYRTPTIDEVHDWKSRSVFDFIAPTLDHAHRLIAARHPERGSIESLPAPQMLAAAQMAMPDAHVVTSEWLHSYDNYYYERHTSFDLGLQQPVKTLPVLRVKFDDPKDTWLYVAPSHGQILKFEGIERANRWGYYALHSFDYGFLFRHRPVWDIAVLILLSGVAVLAGRSLLPAWRRLRRTVRRTT